MRKKIINKKMKVMISNPSYLEESMKFIHESLKEVGTPKKLMIKTELLAEETIVRFVDYAKENAVLSVQVRKFTGDAVVTISLPGEKFDIYAEDENLESEDLEGDIESKEAENAIRSILLRANGEKYKYNHKNKVNKARILTGQSEQNMIYNTIIALALGILVGLFLKFLPFEGFAENVSESILNPLKTMFMNALKIIIAPVVFFSIVTCISQFKNIAEIGKLGIKLLGFYMMTTVMAVLVGLAIVTFFSPGTYGFAKGLATITEAKVDTSMDTSLMHTIINIVPSNFLKPFLESDTLQIIFLAVICGIAVGMIGEYSVVLKDIFEACNSLFLTITTMITRFIPVAVFCSTSLMVLNIGGESVVSIASVLGCHILAISSMIIIYAILLIIFGRLNPLKFFKKDREGMLTSFTLSSSSAAMPTNMRICTENLGVSPKVSSFSIPLGATVNMDGTCIFLSIISIFLAKAYGVDIPSSAMLSLVVTIILLSLGAPGVPGCALLCLGVVIQQINVPLEAIGLVMAVAPFFDMLDTLSNTTGDMIATVVIAKSEGMLDQEKYNS